MNAIASDVLVEQFQRFVKSNFKFLFIKSDYLIADIPKAKILKQGLSFEKVLFVRIRKFIPQLIWSDSYRFIFDGNNDDYQCKVYFFRVPRSLIIEFYPFAISQAHPFLDLGVDPEKISYYNIKHT